jgi:hypothetical protein
MYRRFKETRMFTGSFTERREESLIEWHEAREESLGGKRADVRGCGTLRLAQGRLVRKLARVKSGRVYRGPFGCAQGRLFDSAFPRLGARMLRSR